MSLTSIGDQKTPGRPIEINFDPELGLPSANQELLLIGHRGTGAASGSVTSYAVVTMDNVADETDADTEAAAKFGSGSELHKMVKAAVKANAGGSTFPNIKCIALAYTDTGFGSSDVALTNAQKVKAEYVVSCYDADDTTTRGKLKDHCVLVSGATRTENNQFGTFGVVANQNVASPSSLASPDSLSLIPIYFRNYLVANTYSNAEIAAASAALMAANIAPFNPLDNKTIGSVPAPSNSADNITVGAGLESETALGKGWTPLRVKANGEVSFVRTVTSRITTDGATEAEAYYDVQDHNVLFYWRKTVFTRLNQSDMRNVKASEQTAKLILGEVIRLAQTFEDNGMFQAVSKLAKQFKVQRSQSDRHRFDILTPVNVVPGLHVLATNIRAGTQFDTLSV